MTIVIPKVGYSNHEYRKLIWRMLNRKDFNARVFAKSIDADASFVLQSAGLSNASKPLRELIVLFELTTWKSKPKDYQNKNPFAKWFAGKIGEPGNVDTINYASRIKNDQSVH